MRTLRRSSPIDSGDGFTTSTGIDLIVLGVVVSLLLFGWVMITSASLEYAELHHKEPFYYFLKHGIYMSIAMTAALIVFYIPIDIWERCSAGILIISFILLTIIFIDGVGVKANAAVRWLAVGPFTLQVSEVAKIGVVLYLSSYLVRQSAFVKSHFLGFMNPMAVIAAMIVLILFQPDFGAVVVLLATALTMLFLGGVKIWQFLCVIVVCSMAGAAMIFSTEYRLNRFIAYFDPWSYQDGGAYQLIQSLIAIGRGEWFGLGLGNSIQKLFFLPEAHTDFIFSIIAEELGLFGCILVLALYGLLLSRMLFIARRAEVNKQEFSAYIAYGTLMIFSLQLFINVGVSTGLLPTKGLTLPFLSYGGSSLLVSCVFIALLLRLNKEVINTVNDQEIRKGNVLPTMRQVS